jgi:hypothetical protein
VEGKPQDVAVMRPYMLFEGLSIPALSLLDKELFFV